MCFVAESLLAFLLLPPVEINVDLETLQVEKYSSLLSPAAHVCLWYKRHYSLIWFVDAVQELRRKEEAAARGISFSPILYPFTTSRFKRGAILVYI